MPTPTPPTTTGKRLTYIIDTNNFSIRDYVVNCLVDSAKTSKEIIIATYDTWTFVSGSKYRIDIDITYGDGHYTYDNDNNSGTAFYSDTVFAFVSRAKPLLNNIDGPYLEIFNGDTLRR